MLNNPNEIAIGGVYLPPLLIAALLGLIAALVTVNLLNRYHLARFFSCLPVVFLGFVVIYTCLIGIVLIPF